MKHFQLSHISLPNYIYSAFLPQSSTMQLLHHYFTTFPTTKTNKPLVHVKQNHTNTIVARKITMDPPKTKNKKKTLPEPQLPTMPPAALKEPRTINPKKLNPLQTLIASTLDKIEYSIILPLEKSHDLPKTIDPTVQIAGNFAPVHECPVRHGLQVVGHIPDCLRGVYLRNGANPMFEPTSGHHLFDGDGMIHAVTLGPNNQASYSCRYTHTSRLKQEAELGRPIFPKPLGEFHGHLGLARLAIFMARAGIGLIDISRGYGVANAGLVFFNGKLLAMSEDDLPYHVKINGDGDLETIGRFNFNDQLHSPMIAHPKVDPTSGDLHALSYNVAKKPYLKYLRFDETGQKLRDLDITLDQPTMIHDFAITENCVVIPDHQLVFQMSNMFYGGSPVVYDRSKVSRFGILDQNDVNESRIQWIDVPNFFCFHLWNAWEEISNEGDKIIVVIGSTMNDPESIFSESESQFRTELSEIRLNLRTGKSTRKVIVKDINLEVGQVNRNVIGKKTRFVYLAIAEPWPKCSGIAKVDLETKQVMKYMYGRERYGGEPCFVPQNGKVGNKNNESGSGDDDEGYIVGFVRDEIKERSEMAIVNATSMKQVGSVILPSRVPYGLHGTFVCESHLKQQPFS